MAKKTTAQKNVKKPALKTAAKVSKSQKVKKEIKVKKKVEDKSKKKTVAKTKVKALKSKQVKEKKPLKLKETKHVKKEVIKETIRTTTPPPKPARHVKGYSSRDLEHFRKIILEKKNEIIEDLQSLREQMLDPTTGEYINENSPYSLHMAEQGTDAMEREKTFLYAQRENKFLGYLEDAIKRIDAGTYGLCAECIDEPQNLCPTCPLIPKERLIAVPHSQLCLPIKIRQEKKKNN